MNRIFLSVGKEFNDTEAKQAKVAVAINALQWFDLPASDLPFSQGQAINELIKQMGNNPDKIGYGIYDNNLTLLGMRNNYSRGKVLRATVYAIDTGVEVVAVAVDEETTRDSLK